MGKAYEKYCEQEERERPLRIMKLMEEFGGRRIWKWNVTQIATKAVELGLEERYTDNNKVCYRTKKAEKRNKGGKGKGGAAAAAAQARPPRPTTKVNGTAIPLTREMRDAIAAHVESYHFQAPEADAADVSSGFVHADIKPEESYAPLCDQYRHAHDDRYACEAGPSQSRHPMPRYD